MIKRRFYKLEHSARDGSSSSSSSESEDEVEEREEESHGEEEVENKEVTAEEWRKQFSVSEDASSGSGYESEESSRNDISCDATGLPLDDDDDDDDEVHQGQTKDVVKMKGSEDQSQSEMDYYVLKHKSVFKCRICPRIICLSENTLLEHLKSKRHARSEKLLKEGRLKLMLNSDGEIEEDQETHAERHARTIALAQISEAPKKKRRGRQRQRERMKLKSSKPETLIPKEGKKNRPKAKEAKRD